MTDPRSKKRFEAICAALLSLASGLCIGWLAGLSVSPVLSTVMMTILGLAAGGATGFHFSKRDSSITALSVLALTASLLGGIAVGAPVGIVARTNNWFGAPMSAHGPGEIPQDELAQRQATAGLFSIKSSECAELLSSASRSEEELRRVLRASKDPRLSQLAARPVEAPLAQVVRVICAP